MSSDNLIKPAFTSKKLEEERDKNEFILNVRLNPEERKMLADGMIIIKQQKESTALKTLAKIGLVVLQDKKTELIVATVLGNLRRNERTGIIEVEPNV
jgi:hypothetical protein